MVLVVDHAEATDDWIAERFCEALAIVVASNSIPPKIGASYQLGS
jgi:hypothetical protein